MPKAAELDQPMLVAAIACQAGGLDREDHPCEQDLCIAVRHNSPWVDLGRADKVVVIEADAAVRLVGQQVDPSPNPGGSAVDNFGESDEYFVAVNASRRIIRAASAVLWPPHFCEARGRTQVGSHRAGVRMPQSQPRRRRQDPRTRVGSRTLAIAPNEDEHAGHGRCKPRCCMQLVHNGAWAGVGCALHWPESLARSREGSDT